MPIVFERAYKASDGKCYATLDEAQAVEISALLKGFVAADDAGIGDAIVAYKDEIVTILTLNDSSRPKARGVRKPRKSKANQPELPKVVQS